MGLLWSMPDQPAKQAARKTFKITATEAKYLNCSHCSLDKARLETPKMKPEGSDRPLIYVLGDRPSERDDEDGLHFAGTAGELFRGNIPDKYISQTRWNYVLRCHTSGAAKGVDIECCRKLQVEDISKAKPSVIIAAGSAALQWFAGADRQIDNWRGRRMPVTVGGHTAWLYIVDSPTHLYQRINDKKNKNKADAFLATFKRDMKRVFRDIAAGLPAPYVEPESDFLKNIESFMEYGKDGVAHVEQRLMSFADDAHAIDIETTGLRPYAADSKILTIAVGTFEDTFAFPYLHREARWTPKEKAYLFELIGEYLMGKGRKWAHGAKFEMEWFHRWWGPAVLYETDWGDTLGQAHILDERKGKALDELTQLYFGFRLKDQSNVDLTNMDGTPLIDVLPYNGMDTKYTDALSYLQTDALEAAGLTHVYDGRHAATPSFVQMQAKGVHRNMAEILKLDDALTKQENAIIRKVIEHPDVVRYRNGGTRKFSPTSNPDLTSFFKDFLKLKSGGKYSRDDSFSVDEDSLANIAHPVAGMVLELRSTNKNHGYVTPLLEGGKYVWADGLVHASYSQYITVSGRAACQDPNQQNYPRRKHKEIRRVIGCPPGHIWVSCDYGQIEVRIIASASKDAILCKEVYNGQDVHADWTDAIGNKFLPRRIKTERKAIRDVMKSSWTFANFYGNTLEAVAYDLQTNLNPEKEINPKTLQPFFDDFWTKYAGVKAWQERQMKMYWREGYVETLTGQRRHEPMTRNEIGNHLSQGTAGHLVIDAQARIARMAYEQDRPQLIPIMNIHDDLSFYLPEATAEQDIEDIARVMCTGTFDFINVPLTVEVSVGSNWADKEEIHTFNSKDFV